MGFYYIRTARNWKNQVQSVLGVSYSAAACNNALCIFSQLYTYGWTKNAIYGALGNFEAEGLMNPGQFQITTSGNENMNLGFGLVQWTPAINMIIQAQTHGVSRGYLTADVANALTYDNNSVCDGYMQCANIAAAMATDRNYDPQYAKVSRAPLTAREFTQSSLHWETLASYWLYGYERPGDPAKTEQTRKDNATDWHDYIEAYGAASLPMQGGTLPPNFPPFTAPGGAIPPVVPPDPEPEIPVDPNPPDPEPGTPTINKVYCQPTFQDAKIGDRVKVKAVGYGDVRLDQIEFVVDTNKLEILEIRNGECTVLVKAAARGGAFIRAQWSVDPSVEQTVLIRVQGALSTQSNKWIYYLKPVLH